MTIGWLWGAFGLGMAYAAYVDWWSRREIKRLRLRVEWLENEMSGEGG